MQKQSQKTKLKAIKHALSILRAENIPISQNYLIGYYKINNIDMTEGPILQKRRENYNGCRDNA